MASLMAIGLVKLKRVVQEGMLVRASAAADSLRCEETPEGLLEVAPAEVALLPEIEAIKRRNRKDASGTRA